MITIYGISNCDTMKKARRWLADHQVEHDFHDYRKHGLEAPLLEQWISQVGFEPLLNRRGTTWRKLDPAVRDNIDAEAALQVMLESPAIIKRPVLVKADGSLLIGFNEADYANL